jgi:hypothetical protein
MKKGDLSLELELEGELRELYLIATDRGVFLRIGQGYDHGYDERQARVCKHNYNRE